MSDTDGDSTDGDVEDLLILMELLDDDAGGILGEMRKGATYDNIEDWISGTGRWDRKDVPHEKRWWKKKAQKVPSATFRSWFRMR